MDDGPNLHQRVRVAMLLLGPLLAWAAYWLLPGGADGLSPGGRGACAVALLMGLWWLTEALPLAATSLIPIAAFPLLGVLSVDKAAAPFADKIVFLFLGGFMLQAAMERWGLHMRLALITMLAVGTRPKRLVLGVMLATGFISMWVSNTATAAMMLPISVSIVRLMVTRRLGREPAPGELPPDRAVRNFAVCMMLAIVYSATIGGLATPIGTPPNLLGLAYLKEKLGVEVSFARWAMLCAPLALILLLTAWFMLTSVVFPVHGADQADERGLIQKELRQLGPVKPGEWVTLVVFCGAALAWVFRNPLSEVLGLYHIGPGGKHVYDMLEDHVIAIVASLALFCTPLSLTRHEFVLDWKHASKLPYGVLLLFGGGLTLAAGFSETGVDQAIGRALAGLGHLPTLAILVILTGVTVFVSEFMSNLALVATFLPVVHGAAGALGIHPAIMVIPLTLGASTAFMLPAGTPPNAIVFSSGYLTIPQMARAGLLLNLISIVLVSLAVYWFGEGLLGVSMGP